jgi:hypothetical protein
MVTVAANVSNTRRGEGWGRDGGLLFPVLIGKRSISRAVLMLDREPEKRPNYK